MDLHRLPPADLPAHRGSMAGLHGPLPTLRPWPRGQTRTARGRRGSLLLRRIGLSPTTPGRSPGALPNPTADDPLAHQQEENKVLIRPAGARKAVAVYLSLSSRSATPSQDGRPREPRPTRDMGFQAGEIEMPVAGSASSCT